MTFNKNDIIGIENAYDKWLYQNCYEEVTEDIDYEEEE